MLFVSIHSSNLYKNIGEIMIRIKFDLNCFHIDSDIFLKKEVF